MTAFVCALRCETALLTNAAIHQDMLQDRVRTESYRDFILGNKHLFRGKTVLDVGCGTGILSMFCAAAGAQQVFAVEKSSIYQKAQQIVFANGFQEKIRWVISRAAHILGGTSVDQLQRIARRCPRDQPANCQGRHYRLRMDGLCFALRGHA